MTSIPITGKITSIEVDDEAPFGFASYTANPNYHTDSPVMIMPTGNKISIIALNSTNPATQQTWFVLSDDFEIGDIVEFFNNDTPPLPGSLSVYDNNNHSLITGLQLGGANVRQLYSVKKVFSGTGNDWIRYWMLG